MNKKYHKKVLFPIAVSYGDFCWGESRICGHFSNVGSHSECDLGFYPLKSDKEGRVLKPVECRDLKEVD